MTVIDDTEIGAEIRTMIIDLNKAQLKQYQPKLTRARGVLPGKNLPTTGNTGTGYTPADDSVTDPKLAVGAVILSGTKVSGVLPSAHGGTGVNNGGRTLTISSNSGTLDFTSSGKTLSIGNSLVVTGTDGKFLVLTGSLTVGADTTITGGGAVALGGYTLTAAKTGTLPVGTGAATRLAYWSDANELTSSGNLTYADPVLEFAVSSSATARGLTLTNAVAATAGGKMRFLKARGSVASPTSISSADQLGSLAWSGHDGGAGYPSTDGASITAVAAEAWGTGAHGTILRLSTTPIGSTTIAVRMLIDETGFIGIGTGTATPAARLQVLESDAATNTVVTAAIIGHDSSGTPAANYGTALAIQGKSSATIGRDMGRLRFLWATATDASRAARGILSAYYLTTERDCIAWEANSTAALVGFLGANPAARQTGGAATAGATYGATEQLMLQKVYDMGRTFGFLT